MADVNDSEAILTILAAVVVELVVIALCFLFVRRRKWRAAATAISIVFSVVWIILGYLGLRDIIFPDWTFAQGAAAFLTGLAISWIVPWVFAISRKPLIESTPTGVPCPSCGTLIPDGFRVCPGCGRPSGTSAPVTPSSLPWQVKETRPREQQAQSDEGASRVIIREKETIREIVRIPCKYCGALMDQTALRCDNCGASVSR